MLAAALQHMAKAQQVGIRVVVGLVDGVAHPCLGGQVQHALGLHLIKQRGHAGAIGQIQLDKAEVGVALQLRQPCLFERNIVVAVEVVDADHGQAPLQQAQGAVHADKTGSAGDENRFHGVMGAGSHRYW